MCARNKILLTGKIWVVCFLLFAGCVEQGRGPSGEDVRGQIAEAYGIESMSMIQKLQYTYNQKDGDHTIRRFWIWEPATDRVTFKGDGHQPAVSYSRKALSDSVLPDLEQIDRWFLHDSYWMLLPFRVAWDHHAEVADMGLCKTPIEGEDARCVNVVYPATIEGHIIGDTYKLFLDGDFRILATTYQPAASSAAELVLRWSRSRLVGPIYLSLNRFDREGRAAVKFTRVGVEVDGKWYWAN